MGGWVVWRPGVLGGADTVLGRAAQESISAKVAEIFKIEYGYLGTLVSNMARVAMKMTTEEVNEKHMSPWSDLCKAEGILNTPLSPYLDQELLYNNNTYVDGSKIEKLGFKYNHPQLEVRALSVPFPFRALTCLMFLSL
jgi:hypothetical protein